MRTFTVDQVMGLLADFHTLVVVYENHTVNVFRRVLSRVELYFDEIASDEAVYSAEEIRKEIESYINSEEMTLVLKYKQGHKIQFQVRV